MVTSGHLHPSPKAHDDTEEGAEPAQPKGGAKLVTPHRSVQSQAQCGPKSQTNHCNLRGKQRN